MEYSRAERAILWLCAKSGYDERTRAALLRAAGDPARLLSDFEKISASVIQDGQKRVYKGDRATREREADALCAELSEKGYFAVTAASEDYPAALRYAYDPPLVLYGAGNRSLLSERKFCIVGSRILPPWAEKTGRQISEANIRGAFAEVYRCNGIRRGRRQRRHCGRAAVGKARLRPAQRA